MNIYIAAEEDFGRSQLSNIMYPFPAIKEKKDTEETVSTIHNDSRISSDIFIGYVTQHGGYQNVIICILNSPTRWER